MSSMDADSRDAQSGDPQTGVRNGAHVSFWIRELPFSLVLILTLLGVAYTSFLKQPIMDYWELLAPVIGLVCIGSGWSSANDKSARLQLICTQALHWAAFLLVMSMILLPNVQRDSQCQRDRARRSHVVVARHLYRGCSCPFVAGLSSRDHHGALRSGGGRSFRSDYRVDLGSCAWNWRRALVALA